MGAWFDVLLTRMQLSMQQLHIPQSDNGLQSV